MSPIRKFVPVAVLNQMEIFWVYQFPSSEDIDFVRPYGANVVEANGKIQQEKGF